MDEGNLKYIALKYIALDIEQTLRIWSLNMYPAQANFYIKEDSMCKCNKLVDFLCENHRKAIEFKYHSNSPINPYYKQKDDDIFVIVSKHGAWVDAFKYLAKAEAYCRDKGYKYTRIVEDFGLRKMIWQHPTQDREYAIIKLEVK